MPSRKGIISGCQYFMLFRALVKFGWQFMAKILGGVAENA